MFPLFSLHLWGNIKVTVSRDVCPSSFGILLLGGVEADFLKWPDVSHTLPLHLLLTTRNVSPLLWRSADADRAPGLSEATWERTAPSPRRVPVCGEPELLFHSYPCISGQETMPDALLGLGNGDILVCVSTLDKTKITTGISRLPMMLELVALLVIIPCKKMRIWNAFFYYSIFLSSSFSFWYGISLHD